MSRVTPMSCERASERVRSCPCRERRALRRACARARRTHLLYLELVEDLLEDLVVADAVVLGLGVELDLVHGHDAGVKGVHELARNCARAYLLHLGQLQVQRRVEPAKKFAPSHEVRSSRFVHGDSFGARALLSCRGDRWVSSRCRCFWPHRGDKVVTELN